jgi:hypothetical protein
MKIGFETQNCRNHGDVFYGKLIAQLYGKYGSAFDLVDCSSPGAFEKADLTYDLMVYKYRPAAASATASATRMKSFLIDHGPLHCNRTPLGAAHFETFTSAFAQRYYSGRGFAPLIKGYDTGFFLTDDLPLREPQRDSCLVYMIHWKGSRANSRTERPFSDEDSIAYLNQLAQHFTHVHVSSHVDDSSGNFVSQFRPRLSRSIVAVQNGSDYRELFCNVGAVFFEYSSVFALTLWNPAVPLFQRVPPSPSGPTYRHAKLFHFIMDSVCYPLNAANSNEVPRLLVEDPLSPRRELAKRLIYGENRGGVYERVLAAIDDALGLL